MRVKWKCWWSEETRAYLLFTSRISSSSLNHLIVESLRTLKNWHHSFRCPDASGKGSPRILRMTCGAVGTGYRICLKYISLQRRLPNATTTSVSTLHVLNFIQGPIHSYLLTSTIWNINSKIYYLTLLEQIMMFSFIADADTFLFVYFVACTMTTRKSKKCQL